MTRRPRRVATAAATTIALFLGGCGLFESNDPTVLLESMTAQEIFVEAETLLEQGEPAAAADTYDEVERLYPFSQWAKRSIIMSAFANYQAGRYTEARAAASRYLDFYPSDEDAPYAQYLIGLTHYDNIVDVGRDQAETERALQELTEVVRRYPQSEFARDAQLKVDLTLDHLAGKEMEVGRYYLKRGYYMAAINRFRIVVERYQTTSQTPEALHRLVEAHLALGLRDEAMTAGAILGFNFRGSDWYADSYALLTGEGLEPRASGRGFLSKVWRQVILGEWL